LLESIKVACTNTSPAAAVEIGPACKVRSTAPVAPAASGPGDHRTTPSPPNTPPPSADTKLAPAGTGTLNCRPDSVPPP
jgi:hypothetical protein